MIRITRRSSLPGTAPRKPTSAPRAARAAWRRWCAALFLMLSAQIALAQTVTLNLKDADIGALISTVAEITGRNFIIDPRVKGKVTVISSKPMDADEVYQVFLSILEVHNFAVVPSGNVFKVVPDVNAKQGPVPTIGREEREPGDQMATQVIQVQNVSAAQLVPILRPLIPQQGHLAAYPSTNVLIISDRAANIERLVTIIRRIDQVSDSELEVIRLQYASAVELVRILTNLMKPGAAAAQGGAPTAGATFIADERTNSIIMSGDRSARLPVRAIIAHLDTPMETGGNTKVIYLRYAQAKDMVAVLKGVGTTESQEAQGQAAAPAGRQTQFDIQADEATNALVITAQPDIMRSLEAVIRQLDVRRAQVLVEAIIAEVSKDKSKQLGVQWAVDGTPSDDGPVGGTSFDNAGTSAAALLAGIGAGTPPIASGVSLGVGRFNDPNLNFAILLQALASDADTNILSTPSLLTLDNSEAEIVIGQNVPFVTGSFTTTTAGGTPENPFQTIQRQDVGLTLKIKPQINEGNAVKLDIEQEVSSLSSSTIASDVITDKRSIKTAVLVDDGQLIVLGGLVEDQLRESVQKVPLLGDIPLLGMIFRSKSTSKDKTNLMVFIRPAIVRDDAVGAFHTNSKYNYIRAQQLETQRRGIHLMRGESVPVLPELQEMLDGSKLPPVPAAAVPAAPSPAPEAAPAGE